MIIYIQLTYIIHIHSFTEYELRTRRQYIQPWGLIRGQAELIGVVLSIKVFIQSLVQSRNLYSLRLLYYFSRKIKRKFSTRVPGVK